MSKQTLIVPHDFTEVADSALKHALVTANIVNAEVHLLHVVEKKTEINSAKSKLEKLIENVNNTNDIKIIPHVRIGNIFDDIGDFASEIRANLIFMGTHGAHGWQHITGSHALKVVTSSAVPFIIVQSDNVDSSGYDDIVVPLDLHRETKQKLTVVANMAKFFDSKVHVVIPDEKDEYLKRTVAANIIFANKFFNERNISITTEILSPKNFDDEVINYAKKINADLIAIMNLSKNQMFSGISSKHEQNMITNNAQIPVLLVNPVTRANTVQYLFAQ
ncbi:MAG TPA: hypothetical protein EYG85_11320 [Crocinitomix sp.]|nr:hypothetical protein [Crocinitomix sp.]